MDEVTTRHLEELLKKCGQRKETAAVSGESVIGQPLAFGRRVSVISSGSTEARCIRVIQTRRDRPFALLSYSERNKGKTRTGPDSPSQHRGRSGCCEDKACTGGGRRCASLCKEPPGCHHFLCHAAGMQCHGNERTAGSDERKAIVIRDMQQMYQETEGTVALPSAADDSAVKKRDRVTENVRKILYR